jgi:hypothetical protein
MVRSRSYSAVERSVECFQVWSGMSSTWLDSVPLLGGLSAIEHLEAERRISKKYACFGVDLRFEEMFFCYHFCSTFENAAGGGFVTGRATDPLLTGEELAAEQQVVVVSMNYRVGPLGWADRNYGFLDQLLALKWTKKVRFLVLFVGFYGFCCYIAEYCCIWRKSKFYNNLRAERGSNQCYDAPHLSSIVALL